MVFVYNNVSTVSSVLTSTSEDNKRKPIPENKVSIKQPSKKLTFENKSFLESLGFKVLSAK